MKKILLLGAGLVARPLADYLLARNDVQLTVMDIELPRAQKLVKGYSNGQAAGSDSELSNLPDLISECDLCISLLPAFLHVKVAKVCLSVGRHLITASYVSPEMEALNDEAMEKGLLFLNELGLDPGIDHMSAMKVIDLVREKGGYISSFRSICGGLPAPEAADNPFSYKFSWSPLGALTALKNPAEYLKNGRIVKISDQDLMDSTKDDVIEGYGSVEVYPNRNSVRYKELYGIEKAGDVMRGTIRNPGWKPLIKALKALDYLNADALPDSVRSYAELTNWLMEKQGLAFLGDSCGHDKTVLNAFAWLGLNQNAEIPEKARTPLTALTALMEKKMSYQDGERDMLILQHEFKAVYPDGRQQKIKSLMIDYGIPGGDSAMARTVSLPPAIAAILILEGKIRKRGVRIPLDREIYEPILAELETMNIAFQENWQAAE